MTNALLALLLSLGILTTRDVVRDMSTAAGVDPQLAACIVQAESRWDVMRRGDLDERGLFQILPSTAMWVAGEMGWEGFELDWLNDPTRNIEMGTWILRRWPEWFSTLKYCE